MTTVSTTETEPAQEPFVRFAAFRGKVPLPWVTVFVVALVMGVCIAFRHRDNIRRMRFGTEARVGGRPSIPDSGYA